MRLELQARVFRSAIERLSVLNENGKVKVDAYTHVRLGASPGGMTLATFNRVMRAQLVIHDILAGDNVMCGLPLAELKAFCANLPEADTLAMEFDDTGCTMHCGKARFRTRALYEDAFPRSVDASGQLVDYPRLPFTAVNLQFLFQAVGLVSHCVDTASQRQYAQGIIITPSSISATDGMRLSRVPDLWIKPEKPIAITMESLTRLQKLFKGCQEGGALLRPGELVLTGGGITAVTRLAAWPIPNVEGAFPKTQATRVAIPKPAISQALQRALIVASEKAPQTTLHFSDQGLRLHTEEDGQLSEELVSDTPAPKVSITANPHYLLDAVESVESDEAIFELRGLNAPLIISSEGGDHVNVIMPIQSSE